MYRIFEGVKIVDLTKVFSGPIATRYMADYGAEVIKIESVNRPDPSREYPPLKDGWSGYFELLNRNKKCITLDLKNKKDLKMFYSLVKDADVVVENMTPSAKDNLKIDYNALKEINPEIVYASLAGVDQKTDRKYFDVIAQAESGMMTLTGFDEPTKIGPAIIDAYSGLTLAFGISSALYKREKTGKGSQISVSMLASALNLLECNLIEASVTGKNPPLPGNQDNAIAPFGVYDCKDGQVVIAIGNDEQWNKFANFFYIADDDFKSNSERLTNQSKLTKEITRAFKDYTTEDLLKKLEGIEIPSAKVNTMTDVLANDWMYESGALQKTKAGYTTTGYSLKYEGEENTADSPARKIGENNDEFKLRD